MQIYEVLRNDHRKLQGLLERLTHSADSSADDRKSLISEIRDELIPHSRAEEAVLYNSLRQIEEAKDVVSHSYGEHLEAETLLRTLQAMDAVDANWSSVAIRFRDAINHHINEEETAVFDTAKQVLAKEEAEMMAVAFEKMKPEVREGGFIKNTLELIANAMPVRFSDSLRSWIHPT